MAATTTLVKVLQTGLIAGRPAANAVAAGSLYCATDDGHIYQSDGASWSVWASLAAAGGITEAQLSLSDITTDNVSITKHGFAPKAPNDATKFLDGTGAYTVP